LNGTNDHDAVRDRYRRADGLARSGRHEAALAEYLWCYDEGMRQSPSFAGVRLSFLLSSIAKLGTQFPPARAALALRREAASAAARQPNVEPRVLAEFVALNRVLGEAAESLKFFDALAPGDPRKRLLAWPLFAPLLAARRYAEVAAGVSFADAQSTLEDYTHLPTDGTSDMARRNQESARQTFANFIEMFAGTGDLDHARAIVARAVAFDASPEARQLYRTHLSRAGHPELLPE
jgi:hypothetical protein